MSKFEKERELARAARFEALASVLGRPRRRTDVRTRLIDGETIVLDRRQELVHQLNRTASYIWQRLDGQRTPAEIAEQICQAFEVDEATALKDVLETIARLRKLDLLENT
ncbi:MAG TPA: PqqD family protein [Candidatus Acidoferrales bacterium]|nr:PqqD family protein [Candidatus Acidoferrales bacterium]